MQQHKTLSYDPEVIKQLKKKENITIINKVKGSQIYKYEICVLSKLKQIMSRRPLSEPATGPYERIYFNLIIFDKGWDGSYYVAHCVNEYTKQHQVKILKLNI